MPSHKGHLKNTKTKKVKVIYDNRWENTLHQLRKFLSTSRGRPVAYVSMDDIVALRLVSPGHWSVHAKISFINPENPFHYSGRRSSVTGKGRTPEAAFYDWWTKNMTKCPEGWAKVYDHDNRIAWVNPKKHVFKIFDFVNGRWTWLEPLVFGEVKEAVI